MNTPRLQRLVTMAALIGCAAPVAAQTPIVPTALKTADGKDRITVTYHQPAPGTILDPGEHPVAALTRVYNTGNGEQLNALGIEILGTLSCDRGFFTLASGKPCGTDMSRKQFDFNRDYVLVTWVGLDFSGKRVVYRIGLHDERKPDPYNMTLPGLGRSRPTLYEVFLSVAAEADHASLYVFTALPDPVQAQIPAFVSAASGPMFASAGKLFGSVNKAALSVAAIASLGGESIEKTEGPVQVSVKVSTLIPPLKLAKIKVSDVAVQPLPYVDFQRQVSDLTSKLLFIDIRQSTCASAYVNSVAPQLALTAKSDDCTGAASTPAICRSAFGAGFEQQYAKADAECARTFTVENDLRPQRTAMQQVDTEFRKLVAAQQPERLTAESTLTNAPLTHWSFGLLTAYAVGETTSATRVKVGSDGKLAPDPLSRQLTAVVVNLAPAGYPADAPTMSWAERVRGFAGATLTPEFGVAAGMSVQIWRGVGVNAGGAWMFIPTFGNAGDQLGQTPASPNAPFGTARATAFFVGAHYTFSGR